MEIPEAFDKMSNVFHQDYLLVYENLEQAIKSSPNFLTPDEKISAKQYLDRLLGGAYTDLQLAKIWNCTLGGCGGFCISEDEENGASWFLERLRESLIDSMNSSKSPGR